MDINYTKSSNDDIESDFREAKIPFQLKLREEYDTYTKVLEERYKLSETARLELYSTSREAVYYGHLACEEWSDDGVLSLSLIHI